ncbi:MarR family winged helix-turn-helix transcriptional regulator [Rhodoligotrophos defluvii]|uniref:MarR family winged helix-turn-helix transcriptional regulator n=1 Tax=Rhodoligotrophos defluvii TaxID=2561934 RepID=UPI0010C94D74|nr:MarR family winged helix-turn-helix transcriptional regulator [Rhodoligotrophos defluvii]
MTHTLTMNQALKLWQTIHLDLVKDGQPDLSARQTAILLSVYLEPPPHTIRALAARLSVTKPVITRALDSMGKEGLISRRRDQNDRRNVLVQRTVKGSLFLEHLGDLIIAHAQRATS